MLLKLLLYQRKSNRVKVGDVYFGIIIMCLLRLIIIKQGIIHQGRKALQGTGMSEEQSGVQNRTTVNIYAALSQPTLRLVLNFSRDVPLSPSHNFK